MSVEIELSCPLGMVCEKVEDGKIKRCMWYRQYKMQDPQDADNTLDQWDCAINWQNVFTIGVGRQTAGVQKATEEVRNKTHEANAIGAKLLQVAANAPREVHVLEARVIEPDLLDYQEVEDREES